jgi:HlyD family secretion protein
VEVETGEQLFEQREIQTGLSDGINIEVLSGLTLSNKIKKQ